MSTSSVAPSKVEPEVKESEFFVFETEVLTVVPEAPVELPLIEEPEVVLESARKVTVVSSEFAIEAEAVEIELEPVVPETVEPDAEIAGAAEPEIEVEHEIKYVEPVELEVNGQAQVVEAVVDTYATKVEITELDIKAPVPFEATEPEEVLAESEVTELEAVEISQPEIEACIEPKTFEIDVLNYHPTLSLFTLRHTITYTITH